MSQNTARSTSYFAHVPDFSKATEVEKKRQEWYDNLPFEKEIEVIDRCQHNPQLALEAVKKLGLRQRDQANVNSLIRLVQNPDIRPMTVEEMSDLRDEVGEGDSWEAIAQSHKRSVENIQKLLQFLPDDQQCPLAWSRNEVKRLLKFTRNLTSLGNMQAVADRIPGRSRDSCIRMINTIAEEREDKETGDE